MNKKTPTTAIITFLIFTVSLLLSGLRCTTDPVVIDPQTLGDYYVYSVISPNIDQQGAIVGKTIPENMPYDISGALVQIHGDDGTFALKEYKPGIYIDMDNTLRIIPAVKYFLTVMLPNGRRLSGETTVPGRFNILNHADSLDYTIRGTGDSAEYQVPCISWTRSANAYDYNLSITNVKKEWDSGGFATSDTTVSMPILYSFNAMRDDTTISSMKIETAIKITARDSSYQSCFKSISLLTGEQNTNITGGKGYFTSYCAVFDTVYLNIKRVK